MFFFLLHSEIFCEIVARERVCILFIKKIRITYSKNPDQKTIWLYNEFETRILSSLNLATVAAKMKPTKQNFETECKSQ